MLVEYVPHLLTINDPGHVGLHLPAPWVKTWGPLNPHEARLGPALRSLRTWGRCLADGLIRGFTWLAGHGSRSITADAAWRPAETGGDRWRPVETGGDRWRPVEFGMSSMEVS